MRRIASKYNLNPVDCILPRGTFYPSHVLDCFCNKLIKEKVILICVINGKKAPFFQEIFKRN